MTGRPSGWLAAALVRLGHRHPRAVIAGAAVVIVAGVLLGTRLSFETDVLSLMPRHDPVVSNFRRTLAEFGSLDTLLVAVKVGGEDRLELALALTDELAEKLRGSPHLTRVQSQLDDPVKLAEAVLRHAVLFLDADGLDALGDRLSDHGLAARAADIRAALDTPHGILGKELAVRDPLGFLPLLLGRLSSTPSALKVDFSSGHFLSADHSLVLVLAKPIGPAQNIDFDQRLLADVGARIAQVRQRFVDEEGVAAADLPEVVIGGGHRTAFEDASLIKKDIVSNSVTSVIGVLLLFFLAYRRFATAHYAFLPLATGLAMTFIFTALALGRLNSATSGFSALLVGLGIDFTIVTYGRYVEGRLAGLPCGDALEAMAVHTGPAVLLGAITTVGTFFAFLATRFIGLREFGLLTGVGIMFMCVSAFLLLPALVTLFDHDKVPRPPSRWLNLGPVLVWAERHSRAVLTAAGVITVAAIVAMRWLTFDDDVRNLRSPSNQGVAVQEEVARAFGLSFNAMMVRIEAPDIETVLARVQLLASGLDRLRADGSISSYESLASLIPPRVSQENALAWLAAHQELSDPARVRSRLFAALAANGLVSQAFAPGLATLAEAMRPARPVSVEVWRDTPVQQVVDRSLRQADGRVTTVVNVFSPPGKWRREAPPGLVELVRTVPGASLTGVNLVSQRLRLTVWQDAALAGALGLVLVVGLLLWQTRSIGATLICLMPVAVGVLWALGIMAAAGYPLNLLNVFVITMVIGVGSDYAIYMLYRAKEGMDAEALGQTARAVLLSALTTVVGFGTLITTHYPGLQSMGWMASLGVMFACFGAVVLVPLVLRWAGRSG
jgi:hypothetical protein